MICLVELREKTVVEEAMRPADFWLQEVEQFKYNFNIVWQFRYTDEGVLPLDIDQVEVIAPIAFLPGGSLGCHGEWASLQSLEDTLPKPHPSSRKKDKPAEQVREFVPEAWMKHPAMWEFLQDEKDMEPIKRRLRTKVAATAASAAAAGLLSGEVAVDELVRRRAELGDDEHEAWRSFFLGSCVEGGGPANTRVWLSMRTQHT